jgi:hypothetical protein
MRIVERLAPHAFGARVWRDLTLLAAQSLIVGIAAGVLLGLAVFAVAG